MTTAPARIDYTALQGDYPLANTTACRMLAKALDDVAKDPAKGWSQRQIARMLDYKTSVVISHMASGRVPIPVDRAIDFARLLKMDASEFLIAVLEQRHPQIDFRRALAQYGKPSKGQPVSDSALVTELESIAGMPLDDLPVPVVNVLREVVADRNGARRFLKMNEVPVIEHLRRIHPDGLSPAQMRKLMEAIDGL